ncbi:hypothetical protein ACOSQ2_025069 [Xanthoceras sorbifolium]
MHCVAVPLWIRFDSFRFLCDIPLSNSLCFLDFIMACHYQLLHMEFLEFIVLLWRVWYRRNKVVHDNVALSMEETVAWAHDFFQDFQQTVLNPPELNHSPLPAVQHS